MGLKIEFLEAVEEFRNGWLLREAWISLSREQLNQRYARIVFGPFWPSLHYLAFVAAIVLFFRYGQTDIMYFAAYVSVGLFLWLPLMQAMSAATAIFSAGSSFAHGAFLPLSVLVMRRVWETLIEWTYLLPFCLAILFFTGHWPHIAWLWALPSMILIVATLPAVITILGSICVINPSIQLVIQRILGVLMFVTPIFWIPTDIGGGRRALFKNIFNEWNPLSHYLRIVRDPLIDGGVPIASLGICVVMTFVLWISALMIFGSLRKKIMAPK